MDYHRLSHCANKILLMSISKERDNFPTYNKNMTKIVWRMKNEKEPKIFVQ